MNAQEESILKKITSRMAAICLTTVLFLVGCGSEPGVTAVSDESSIALSEKIQIEIGFDGDESLGEELRKIADGFNASQEKYEAVIDEQAGGWNEDGEGVTASVVFTNDNVAAAYAEDARRLDLRRYMSSEDDAHSLYNTIESLPESMHNTVCDDERGVFYLPVSVTAPVLYYNKTIYDSLSLELPKNFEQLRENCLTVYAKHRIPGYLAYDLEGDIMAMIREQETPAGSGVESAGEGAAGTAGAVEGTAGSAGAVEGAAGTAGTVEGASGSAGTVEGTTGTAGAVEGAAGTAEVAADAMTRDQILQFFAGNFEAGYFRMVHHETYAAMDFATGAVAAYAGTPADHEMATEGVTFDVGAIPWVMDREDAVYWVDTDGMLFIDQGEEKNAGAAEYAEYLLSGEVCSELLEVTGGISPYGSVYNSQAYRKNRRGFDEITKAVSEEIPKADFILISEAERRAADELLLYLMDKRVTAEDAARIMFG